MTTTERLAHALMANQKLREELAERDEIIRNLIDDLEKTERAVYGLRALNQRLRHAAPKDALDREWDWTRAQR